MLPAMAGLLVPLLAFTGVHVHYDALEVPLQPDPACPADATVPLVLHLDTQQACARLQAHVDLPPGTDQATWRFLHGRHVGNDTTVIESVVMSGRAFPVAPADGPLPPQVREVTFDAEEGPTIATWSWRALGHGNVSAQIEMAWLRLDVVAPSDAALRVIGGGYWRGGELVDRGSLEVRVDDMPGWQPWLRFYLEEEVAPTALVGPTGRDLLDQATLVDGVLELPTHAMEGPGTYRLEARMPGSFAPEASLAATFLILVVALAGGAVLAGSVLARFADGPGRSRRVQVRAYAIAYGLLVTTSLVTMWQILVAHDARLMLQSPLHPVATVQYLAMLVLAMLFLVLVLIGGTDIVRDLTRRVRHGQHVNKDLVHAQEEMKHFTVAAAHDLKSPLRAIHAYADLLQRQRPAPAEEEVLESIKRSARRMTEGVEALLQFTRVASTQPHVRNVDVTSLVDEVQKDVSQLADRQEVVLVQEGDAVVRADPRLLQRALENLIDNALKYGPLGGRVTVRAVDDGPGVRIEVADEGDPIPEDQRRLLFEAFHRGARSDVRGTGLGLATVAKVAEMHGGHAGVTCDDGNRFWIHLPGTGIEVPRRACNHPVVPPGAHLPQA